MKVYHKVTRWRMRSRFWVALGIGILVFAAFSLGSSLSGLDTRTLLEQAKQDRMTETLTQSRLLADSVWTSIDALRNQAFALKAKRVAAAAKGAGAELPVPTSPVLHWSELEVVGDRLATVRQSARARKSGPLGADSYFEDRYHSILMDRIGVREIRENGVAWLRVRADAEKQVELAAFVFLSDDGSPLARTAVAVLAPPAEVFKSISGFASHSEGGALRAYLAGADGTVVAHSLAAFRGSDFSRTRVFTEGLQPLFQGARTSGAGTYASIDRQEVLAGYVRMGSLPLGVVVERVMSPPSGGFAGSWARGLLGVVGALLCASAAIWLGRSQPSAIAVPQPPPMTHPLVDEPEETLQLGAGATVAGELSARVGDRIVRIGSDAGTGRLLDSEGVESALARRAMTVPAPEQEEADARQARLRQELAATQELAKAAKRESELVGRFENEAARSRDPKAIARRLAAAAAEICESPTLFFIHHEGVRAAILQADGGFGPGDAPAAMSFPVAQEMLGAVVQAERQGIVASFSQYAPLQKLLLARLGLAHFEAWAVTGYGHLGRAAGRPRLLGILVILEAGTRSVGRYDSLSRMMRSTGLIYENALLSS